MMRPYAAIVIDSFREAFASRVLWVLLVVITLFLLALVPIGISVKAGSYLSNSDLLDREKLIEQIIAAGKTDKPSPGKRIWDELDSAGREKLENTPSEQFARRMRDVQFDSSLRELLAERDFYDKQAWRDVRLPPAARLLERQGLDKLSDEQLQRFNRLALEAAFPDLIAPAPPRQTQLTYFVWEPGLPLPLEPDQLRPSINQVVVAVLSLLLGAFGVFIAVLVTASMIPHAFEAGSVDLLLSKPVARSGVFLAKFFGGCAFIAINAAYLITGVWLILGFRMGLWNERLLLAIPLYVFLFAIYYGVSALAGLVWRNAIVSVVLAVVFWIVCFAMGTAVTIIEQNALRPRRLVEVVPAGDTLIAVNQNDVFAWDEKAQDWDRIFVGRSSDELTFAFASRLVGPVYDSKADRILAFRSSLPGFQGFGSVTRLSIGNQADGWRRTEGVTVPEGAAALFVPDDGTVLIAASDGMHRLQGDIAAQQKDINFFGMRVPLPEKRGGLVAVGPQVQMRQPVVAGRDPSSGEVVLFDGMRLALLAPEGEKFREAAGHGFEQRQNGMVAAAGGQVFLALGGGEVRRYDRKLKPLGALDTGINSTPSRVTVSPDGRYLAIVYADARLWLYDVKESAQADLSVAGRGDVSAASFGKGKLYVADRLNRVTEYDLASGEMQRRWEGQAPMIYKIYRYALRPLYTIFPKPGELNETVSHVLTSDDLKIAGPRLNQGVQAAPIKVDVWGPIWSNSLFLAVVLSIACVYVARKDF